MTPTLAWLNNTVPDSLRLHFRKLVERELHSFVKETLLAPVLYGAAIAISEAPPPVDVMTDMRHVRIFDTNWFDWAHATGFVVAGATQLETLGEA